MLQGVLAPGLATARQVRQEEANLLQVLGAEGDAGRRPARSDRYDRRVVRPENRLLTKTPLWADFTLLPPQLQPLVEVECAPAG